MQVNQITRLFSLVRNPETCRLDEISRSTLTFHFSAGDSGDDTLYGGNHDDILIGDYGRVVWRSSENIVEGIAGQGGYGDMTTHGVITNATDVYSVCTSEGGRDLVYGGQGSDLILGGVL